MTDDIVERLRGRGAATSLELEAADEIERLREALKQARDGWADYVERTVHATRIGRG